MIFGLFNTNVHLVSAYGGSKVKITSLGLDMNDPSINFTMKTGGIVNISADSSLYLESKNPPIHGEEFIRINSEDDYLIA